jgi:hypothetical protein
VLTGLPLNKKEVFVLLLAGLHKAPIGQDHVGFEQVIDGEAVLASKVAVPATQGETRYAGGRDDAGGHGQPEGVGSVVHVAPGCAALDAYGLRIRVDADTPHRREVYHQPVVGQAQAPAIVPAPAYGQEHLVVAGEVHATDDVGHVGAARYHARTLVDHGVVDLAGFLIVRITGLDELPSQARLELLYGRFVVHDGSPLP